MGNAPKKLCFGGGCTRAAGVGSPDERSEEPCKARSQEDAPRVKRAPEGTTRCCAGFPSPAEQYQEPPLDLNELLVKRPAATYFVRVEGDSMVGAGISDGDLLVVDRSLRPADGDVIIASVDGDFTVKTYRRDKSGVRLEPANPNYPVIRLRAGQELDYFGKVTACIHRFAGKR